MGIRTGLSRHWLAICWGFMILVFTGIPGQMIPKVSRFIDMFAPDKIVHLLLFGGFVVTIVYGMSKVPGQTLKTAGSLSLLISTLMGALTEILQWQVFINRQGSVWDFIVDVVGSLLGLVACRYWRGFFLR